MHIDFAINGNIMNFSILIIILYFKVSIIMDPALMPQQLYGYFFFLFYKVGIWLWKGRNGSASSIKVGMEKVFKLGEPWLSVHCFTC